MRKRLGKNARMNIRRKRIWRSEDLVMYGSRVDMGRKCEENVEKPHNTTSWAAKLHAAPLQ